MNDNEEDRACPLAECVPGDIVTHLNGSRWEVVALYAQPTVFLRRLHADQKTGLDRDHVSVVPQSPWGDQFFCLGHFDPDDDGASA